MSMKNLSLALISIYLILAAYISLPDHNLYDSKRIIQMGIFTSIGLTLLLYRLRSNDQPLRGLKKIWSDKRVLAAGLTLLFFGIFSSFYSNYPAYAFLELTFLLLIICTVIIISPSFLREHHFLGRIIFFTAIAYSWLYVIIFIGNYISSFYDPMMLLWPDKYDFNVVYNGVEFQAKEILYFVHRRFFNHTQTWTLPILIGFLCIQKRNTDTQAISIVTFLLLSFWWMLIIASGGRGSTVALIASLGIILIIWRSPVVQFVKMSFATLLSGGILYLLLYKVIPAEPGSDPIMRTTDSGRFSMWERAMNQWLESPVLGTGPMHYAELSNSPYFAHPHNFYVQFLSEWGIVAFIAFVLLITMGLLFIKNHFQHVKDQSTNQTVYVAFSWSLLAALVHSFFSGVMHTPMSQMWLILILAWFTGFKMRSLPNNRSKHHIPAYIYISALVIVLALVWNDLFSLQELYQSYVEKYPDAQSFPRFWGQGLFPLE